LFHQGNLQLPRQYFDYAGVEQLYAELTEKPESSVYFCFGGSVMSKTEYLLHPIGFIQSPLKDRGKAPRQGREGAPDAWLEANAKVADGLERLEAGDEIIIITWFHKAHREVLKVHPRDDKNTPLTGVFATRSPDRPNPIGLHRVTVLEIAGNKLKIGPIEAIDGTPVVDIKPVLSQAADI
jgi:tRNA-Thr(GGU) m(6)t(6)A37 methyltransferase TsaA